MHVLVVIDRIGVQGGSEASTIAIVRGLQGPQLRFSIVCLHPSPEASDSEELEHLGVPVTVLPQGRVARLIEFRRVVRRLRPDVLHAVLFEANLVARTVGPVCRVPVISSLVSSQYDRLAMRAAPSMWKKEVVRAVDIVSGRVGVARFHAVSESVADHAQRRLRVKPARIEVVERGRDPVVLGVNSPERRAAVRMRIGVSPEAPMVLAVARHEPAKGLDVLVSAMADVRRIMPDARLLVAGREGTETPCLRKLIAEAGLEQTVHLLGNRNDVADLLAACDVFVLPSRWEGLPGAVLEAMALEAPIVASDIPGVRDALGESDALLPPGDASALGEALLRMLQFGADEAVVARYRRRFEERFTTEAMLLGMRRLYGRFDRQRYR